jgi:hypothetical protein
MAMPAGVAVFAIPGIAASQHCHYSVLCRGIAGLPAPRQWRCLPEWRCSPFPASRHRGIAALPRLSAVPWHRSIAGTATMAMPAGVALYAIPGIAASQHRSIAALPMLSPAAPHTSPRAA